MVRDAAKALRRERFAQELMRQISMLLQHSEAWESYLAEAEETHVADGIAEET